MQQTEELRDKRKTRHFEKHLHELPAAVQELWHSKKVSRQDKTKLVNSTGSGRRERLAAGAPEPGLRVDGQGVLFCVRQEQGGRRILVP